MYPNNETGAEKMAQYLIHKLKGHDLEKYKISEDVFSTIFLAGSPGAGKTEWIESFEKKERYVILDSDEYRKGFDGYNGNNAEEFQRYASRVMDKMFAFCMKNNLNVIVDGTFANKRIITQNISQCHKRKRVFMVALVIQDPIISFLYTKKRELEKTRKVPVTVFLEKFFSSIDNTRFVIEAFPGTKVLITKKDPNAQKGQRYKNIFIENLQNFDKETEKWYSLRDTICDVIMELDVSISQFGHPILKWLSKLLGVSFK